MGDEEELKLIRLKLYFGPLLPIDNNLIKDFNLTQINPKRIQAYIYESDVHRELFTYILLAIGKKIDRKPSFSLVTMNELIEHHFNKDHPTSAKYTEKDVLFVTYTTIALENKIYSAVLDKIIEERRAYGLKTFLFYKGTKRQYDAFNPAAIEDVIDFNKDSRTVKRKSEVI